MSGRWWTQCPFEVHVDSWGNEWGGDRMVDLVVRELAQYDVVAGALQETSGLAVGHMKLATASF